MGVTFAIYGEMGWKKTALGEEKGKEEYLYEADSPLCGREDSPRSHHWRPVTVCHEPA